MQTRYPTDGGENNVNGTGTRGKAWKEQPTCANGGMYWIPNKSIKSKTHGLCRAESKQQSPRLWKEGPRLWEAGAQLGPQPLEGGAFWVYWVSSLRSTPAPTMKRVDVWGRADGTNGLTWNVMPSSVSAAWTERTEGQVRETEQRYPAG